mgnify:CR=1 FL=1
MLRKLFGATVVGIVLCVGLFVGPAHAIETMTGKSRDVSKAPPGGLSCADGRAIGVLVCFEPYGDKFWIKDTLADGHHVAVSFATGRGEIGSCHNYHGKAAGWTLCDQFAKHISEHETINFIGLTMEGSKILAQTKNAWAGTT